MTIRLRQLVLVALLLLAVPLYAQDAPPAAEIANDEGGPTVIEGLMNYTNLFFTSGVAQPIVLLEDQGGFVTRDVNFEITAASQVLGGFTTDYYDPPVGYTINLPIEPRGTLVDVDNDGSEDAGVMVYTPAYWTNIFGDPFLEVRDGGKGWSTAYAGTNVNDDREIIGGMLVVYAPEEGQGFPSDFGEDGLLFTEDDPIVTIPAGWTTVDLDMAPFTFDRSATANIDLLEPTSIELDDFSDLSYTEAFDAAVELMRVEYSFTEYKNVDWDALVAEFRPRAEEAEANTDPLAYARVLRDLTLEIPDGHVAVFGGPATEIGRDFIEPTAGGLGFNIVELDDGRVIVEFVLEDSPADGARIETGDEIIAFNGIPIQQYLAEEVFVFAGPFSTEHNLRIQQLRYAVRFPVGEMVDVTFINGATGELSTVGLTAAEERATWSRTSILVGAPEFVGPVEYELLPSGYALVAITTFSGNEVLTIQDWENFLTLVNEQGIPGIVVDMRFNGGGSPLLANQMAGYFYDEQTVIGYRASFNEEIGEFEVDTETPTFVYPAPETFRYNGEIAVIVGPSCASACETFSYAASVLDNATVVGTYPSAGLGGGVNDYLMPEGMRFRYTVNRGLNADQEIHIEGIGVVPDVRVPLTEETVFAEGDLELEAAISALDAALTVPFTDAGELAVGESASGTLGAGERVRYTLVGPADAVTITVELADAEASILLSIYTEDGEFIGSVPQNVIESLPLLADVAGERLILEIGTESDEVTTDYTVSVEG
jgi:C-terminal processing protease CtpA/Prc